MLIFFRIIIISIFFNTLFQCRLYAQHPESSFELYSSKNGLPDNNVESIIRDNKGFMWIGTESGLSRFDGIQFLDFTRKENPFTLSATNISKIIPISNGKIGMVTRAGFIVLDPNNFKLQHYLIPDTTSFSQYLNSIRDAFQMPGGNILITTNTGLYEFLPESKLNFRYDAYTAADVNSKRMLYGYTIVPISEVEYLVYNEKTWMSIYNSQKKTLATIGSGDRLQKIFRPAKRWFDVRLLQLTKDDIVLADIKNDTIKYYNKVSGSITKSCLPFKAAEELNWSTGIFKLDDTHFVLTGRETGYYILTLNNKTGTITCDPQKYLSKYTCNVVFVDAEKRIWVGTRVGLLRQKNKQPFLVNYSITSPLFAGRLLPAFHCVYRYKDKLYFGSKHDSCALVVVDTTTMQVIQTQKYLRGDGEYGSVFSIQSYHEDSLWMGTSNGIWWYDVVSKKTGRVKDTQAIGVENWDNVMLYPPDKHGRAWFLASMAGKVANYDPSTRRFKNYDQHTIPAFPFKRVKNIAYDAYGDTWFGGHALTRWNNRLQNFDTLITSYAGPLKYKDDIVALTADKSGSLWLHNANNSLLEYKIKEKRFEHYDGIKYGLSSVVIQSLANEVNNELWYTTGTKLGYFNIATKTAITFSQQDGIPEERSSGRTIYFDAGINKFYSLHDNHFVKFDAKIRPGKIPDSLFLFTQVATTGKTIYFPEKQITLPASTQNFKISYTIIDYDNSEGYNFYYQVNGGGWVSLGSERTIDFYGVNPGKMPVTVKAVSRFGQVFQKMILIKIQYPFWLRWWFIALTALTLAGLIYFLYRYRIKQLKQLYQLRSKISQDLHDEIGATLSGISMYSHVAKDQMKKDKYNEVGQSLDVMQKSASEMVLKLNDIIWLVDPQHDALEKLLLKLEEYAMDMTGAANIKTLSDFSSFKEYVKLSMDVRRNVFLICKEAINNAVKYSRAAHLNLNVSYQYKKLCIVISDDGKGFDMDEVKTGNGLYNIGKRAEDSGLTLELKSTPGIGTSLKLCYNLTH
ncbi:MAG: hypothetical protein H7Y86_02800 [Rhizobacter sp.]|nr:hypothetical protein [Ferruginibacter sp.]